MNTVINSRIYMVLCVRVRGHDGWFLYIIIELRKVMKEWERQGERENGRVYSLMGETSEGRYISIKLCDDMDEEIMQMCETPINYFVTKRYPARFFVLFLPIFFLNIAFCKLLKGIRFHVGSYPKFGPFTFNCLEECKQSYCSVMKLHSVQKEEEGIIGSCTRISFSFFTHITKK